MADVRELLRPIFRCCAGQAHSYAWGRQAPGLRLDSEYHWADIRVEVMLCCVCKQKEATVHLTQIMDGGKMQKVDLCDGCAKEKGVTEGTFSLADMLLGLGVSQEMEEAAAGVELKCPHCGFTQADFKKAGRLGCAHCYETFAEGLEALLKTMHKGTRHKGKVPLACRSSQGLREKISTLQKQLEKAVDDEDFEQAAHVRDEIKAAKAKLAELST